MDVFETADGTKNGQTQSLDPAVEFSASRL